MDDVAEIRAAGVQPATLVEYQAIDFGTGSELRKELLSRVEREAAQDEIALSDICEQIPALLTPEMKAWYQDHVAFYRAPALEEIKKRFAADQAHGGAATCLVEAVRDQAHDDYHAERRRLRQLYLQARGEDRKTLESLTQGAVQAQIVFANLKADLGRDPTLVSPVLYMFVLLGIGVVELLINFEAFDSLPWASPFMATGMTCIVGACIAAASHFHGKLLKQFRAYFDDHVDPRTRQAGIHRVAGGALLLLTALCLIYYARDTYLTQSFMVDASLGGEAGSFLQKLWVIGGSLFSNVLVYLFGAFIAYQMHDEVPLYPATKKSLTELGRKRDALARELAVAEAKALVPAESRRKAALSQLDTRAKAQKAAPNYPENRKLFETLAGQDARVLGALDAYRNALCQRVRGSSAPFVRRDELEQASHRMTPADYQGRGLALKYN